MKILATSDMHGNLENLDFSGIDIAFFAGDIAPLRGHGAWYVHDQLEWMNGEFHDFCSSWPKTKIVFIPGNHDFFPLIREQFSTKLHGKDLSLKLSENATMLIDKLVEIDGLKIYGTPWVPIISYRWAFEADHDRLARKFSEIPFGIDVLLTHTPPRLDYLDVSLEYGVDSSKFGSPELADEIFRKNPKICFCGHIHSGQHIMSRLNESQIWNVARVNESYGIAYDPVIVEI